MRIKVLKSSGRGNDVMQRTEQDFEIRDWPDGVALPPGAEIVEETTPIVTEDE